jgi:hypothetical protein
VIQLNGTGDYLLVIAIAGAGGLLGGLAAELLLNRDGVTGAFELPGRRKGGLFDLGGFSSLVVGVVAGIAILLVMPPQVTVATSATDGSVTSAYEPLRLVATSLVAGSAGGSVLTALQARVTSAINAARVEFVRARAEDEVDRVRDVAKGQLEEAVRKATGAPAAGARARGIGGEAAAVTPVEDVLQAAARAIDESAEQGKRAVTGTARGRSDSDE